MEHPHALYDMQTGIEQAVDKWSCYCQQIKYEQKGHMQFVPRWDLVFSMLWKPDSLFSESFYSDAMLASHSG